MGYYMVTEPLVNVLRIALCTAGTLVCAVAIFFLSIPWMLATVTWLRWQLRLVVAAGGGGGRRRRQRHLGENQSTQNHRPQHNDNDDDDRPTTTAAAAAAAKIASRSSTMSSSSSWPIRVCTGRVWHTRFHPVKHAFTYPLFICCVNLRNNIVDANAALWPLSWIVRFDENDHLKNGEGLLVPDDDDDNNKNNNKNDDDDDGSSKCDKNHNPTNRQKEPSLLQRVFRLLQQNTTGVDWNSHRHDVFLLTHLRYYGYCFNPVSFYGIFHKTTHQLEAVIGEVSNTPWGEMHCYVLHASSSQPKGVQVTTTVGGTNTNQTNQTTQTTTRYVFPKEFHVSPFMEMQYLYDWTFDWTNNRMDISNSLIRPDASHTRQFHAKMSVQPCGDSDHTTTKAAVAAVAASAAVTTSSPFPFVWTLARQLSLYPAYGVIVQFWIHYQALCLFVKGVAFQPHPHGSETSASRWIGRFMTPFLALQNRFQQLQQKYSYQRGSGTNTANNASHTDAAASCTDPTNKKKLR